MNVCFLQPPPSLHTLYESTSAMGPDVMMREGDTNNEKNVRNNTIP